MPPVQVDESDLKRELDDFGDKYPKLESHELFVAWFLRAYVTGSDSSAVHALSGCSNDKGIDAVLIDEAAKAVFLAQGKCRQGIGSKNEKRPDIVSFAALAGILPNPNIQVFKNYLQDLDESLAARWSYRSPWTSRTLTVSGQSGWICIFTGVSQPRISNLACGKIDLFSIDTLIAMLGNAGVRVEVTTSASRVA